MHPINAIGQAGNLSYELIHTIATLSNMLTLMSLYLLAGLIFGCAFVLKGYAVLQPDARGSHLGFRLLLLPANLILWPYLLYRWVSSAR